MKNNKKNFLKNLSKYPRHLYVFSFFIVIFFMIVWKVFSYTVFNHQFYKELADKQQMWKVISPINRWTIYSSNNSWTVLAISVNLNDLAIDPTQDWNKDKLSIYLKDIVYKQICYLKSRSECYDNLLKFVKKIELEDFEYDETYIKWVIFDTIRKKISQTKVTSVPLYEWLEEEKANELKSLNISWVYVNLNSILINPEEIINDESVSEQLSKFIPYEIEDIKHLIRKRETRYIWIINKISIWVSEEIQDYIKEESSNIKRWLVKEEDSVWSFIILSPNLHRDYPEWSIASQLIWFVDWAWVWHYWLEWYFNNILKWKETEFVTKKDVNNKVIDPMWISKLNSVSKWADIYTTIDRNVQRKAETILEEWVKKYAANKWTVIVMDPKTWNLIAVANYPGYNPNSPWDVYELEKVTFWKYPNPPIDLLWKVVLVEDNDKGEEFYYNWKKVYLRLADREELWDNNLVKYKYKNDFWAWVYKNDAISWFYEPWSIMKSITFSIWVDTWEITPNSMYQDNWELEIDDFRIKNVAKECLWYNTFSNALNYSCNVWMIRIAQRYWKALAYEYLNNFWFWEKTWITLDWEVARPLEHYNDWYMARLYTSSYWLGISVTPLQMATAYSVIANWWLYIKPNIIDYIKNSDWTILKYKPEISHRVIKKSTSDTMIDVLVGSVNDWVAKNWQIPWYSIAWKTWTSQIAYKWWYETWIWSTTASFAWFWPAEDPKFVIIVKLDRTRTSEYGSSTSANVFKEMMAYLLDYYSIPWRDVE